MANVLSRWTYTWTGQGEPRNVNCTGISYDFFPVLGVKPYLGRLYEPEDCHVDGMIPEETTESRAMRKFSRMPRLLH
jgi:hypothetical protein